LTIHGFADTYYTSTSQQNSPSGNTGFKLGNLDLYIAPSFTDHIRALMEDVVEFDDWYPPGAYNGQPSIDIERLQIGYVVSNELTVWIGRFHTPYGYWNTAYHHGAQLQPTVMRPQFVAFEDHGGILPAHMDGIWATGHDVLGPGRITYDLYLGNGQRILDGALDMQTRATPIRIPPPEDASATSSAAAPSTASGSESTPSKNRSITSSTARSPPRRTSRWPVASFIGPRVTGS